MTTSIYVCCAITLKNKHCMNKISSFKINDKYCAIHQLYNKYFKKECSICMNDIKDKYILNNCGHSFCRECINKWVSIYNNKCPLCRNDIHIKDIEQFKINIYDIYPELKNEKIIQKIIMEYFLI